MSLTHCGVEGIARQQWRARIETPCPAQPAAPRARIARQQWRARIETKNSAAWDRVAEGSPASNGGRGLKPVLIDLPDLTAEDRPPAMAGAD